MRSNVRQLLRSSLLLLLLIQSAAHSDNDTPVKAAIIFNFFKFIEWPAEVMDQEKFILCVNGESDSNEGLQALDGKVVNGKPITVRQQQKALSTCHMVYLEESRASVMRDLTSYPVVTVSSSSDFLDQGGMIALVPEHDHLGFEINQGLAVEKRIRISALLLKLAISVRSVR